MALDPQQIGRAFEPVTRRHDANDVIMYALGVGAGFDELHHVWERDLKVLPSFAAVTLYPSLAEVISRSGIDVTGLLHGEQETRYYGAIPTAAELVTTGRITGMFGRGEGKGAMVVAELETREKGKEGGPPLFVNRGTFIGRFDDALGLPPAPKTNVSFPAGAPDFVEVASPSAAQPLLFRLSGDRFDLHVDPAFARMAGFEMPIMHGLCTHGFACRAVVRHLCGGDDTKLTRFAVRFSKPLYPGKPIETRIWVTGPGQAVFRVLNRETGEVVIDNGIAEWREDGAAALVAPGASVSVASASEPAPTVAAPTKPRLTFEGRVVLITGAGGGLGRAYALEFARRGAKVVVNDLGTAKDGEGTTSEAAERVVAEIRAAGGEAVANADSVATPKGGEAMVQAAIDAFGRLDIVIHNAGFLRDRSLLKMAPDDWKSIRGVHLDGAYHVVRPAFSHMKDQKFGRIVLVSSAAGLYGNFGQANYSACKMGLVGFANAVRLEGAKYDIKINTVAPVAASRLTEGILPPDVLARMAPEYVVPLVVFLSHPDNPASGQVFNAAAGFFNRAALLTGAGMRLGQAGSDGVWVAPSPEEVLAHFDDLSTMDGAHEIADLRSCMGEILSVLS